MTGWRSRESLPAARRGVSRHGNRRSEDRAQHRARHPLQQTDPVPDQRPPREGRRLDRGARRVDRAARSSPEPQRPAGRGRRWCRNRHVRGARRRAALPRPRTAREAEARYQGPAGAVRGPRRRRRHHARGRFARRERAARAAPSARPVPGLPNAQDEGARRGRDRRRTQCQRAGRQAASAAGFGLAQAARGLCRGRHEPRTAYGLLGHRRSRPAGASLGKPLADLLQRALPDPPGADREQRAGVRSPCPVHRPRRL